MPGQAFCLACPYGTYLAERGANSSTLCQSCPAGRYGDNEGVGTCKICPSGQYQPNLGEVECKECSDIDKFMTTDHTGCIDNEAF